MHDPILEEMQRVKSPGDIKESRYRDWVTYLCALVSRKDDEIATLKARLAATPDQELTEAVKSMAVSDALSAVKRGPGRPRKDVAHVG